MYTQHGHQIAGTTVEGGRPPVVRCGGPNRCNTCREEARTAQLAVALKQPSMNQAEFVHHETEDNEMKVWDAGDIADLDMQRKACDLVRMFLNQNAEEKIDWSPGDIKIVWFAKTLQHFKALVIARPCAGRYYEVTYNGDKKEAYIDSYLKTHNAKIIDG